MKSGTRRILSGVVATALVAILTVPAMAAGTIKEQVNQGQEQTTPTTQTGTMGNFKPSSTYTGFQDVSSSDWYYTAVKTCYELDLMKGNSASTFNPKGNITVAQVITMASRVHKIYFEGTGDFESVGSKWYQTYVDYALEQGIIKASDFSEYDRLATRSEMAYIFANALPSTEYNSINAISELPDVNSNTQYNTQIFSLYNAGIVAGSDQYGTFNPNSNITRAEAAAIINRVAVKSERKTLALEKQDLSEAITITEGQTRSNRPAKAGDTVIKADGTRVVLAIGPNGVLGEGQGVAPDLGLTSPSGFDVVKDQERNGYSGWGKSSVGINYVNDFYYVNPLTGEGHWGAEWSIIARNTYPEYDGKVGEISADKNFVWNEDGVPCWVTVYDNHNLVKDQIPSTQTKGTNQTWTEGESHGMPKVGDTVIKADGTKIVLKEGIAGVLGAGQGVDIWTNYTDGNGHYLKEGMIVGDISQQPFKKDKITGEMYPLDFWVEINVATDPTGKMVGDYEGEVYNTWWQWTNKLPGGAWMWMGPA